MTGQRRIPRHRRCVLTATLASLALAHFAAMLTQSEPWPISDYGLYLNRGDRGDHSTYALYATADSGREFRLPVSMSEPMDPTRFNKTWRRLRAHDAEGRAVQTALAQVHGWYAAHRQQDPSLPPLRRLALKRERYRFALDASTRHDPPFEVEPLAVYRPTGGSPARPAEGGQP